MDNLPCPQCKSSKTLSSLRLNLQAVKDRIAEEKRKEVERRRKEEEAARADAAAANGGLVTTGFLYASSGTHQRMTTLSLGQIDGGRISNDDGLDLLAINDVQLETCADCGTFYAPNAHDLAEKIKTETYKLDLLGAMAGIYDGDAGVGNCGSTP